MSLENTQLDYLLDFQADLDLALSEKDWKKAREIIQSVKEEGYEHEARMMQESLKRATTDESPFVKKTSHLTNEEFMQGYYGSVDSRDEADRNYP